MCSPSAELEEPLDAARVGLFHLRLQLCTETVLVYAQQKTEVEKLNAFGRERVNQRRNARECGFPLQLFRLSFRRRRRAK